MKNKKKPVVTLAGLLQAVEKEEAKDNKKNDKTEPKPIVRSLV